MKKNKTPKNVPGIKIGGNVTTQRGNSNIGNVTGDNANFGYHNYQSRERKAITYKQEGNQKSETTKLETDNTIKSKKEKLDELVRQTLRKLDGNDNLLNYLLTAQQVLTKARYLNTQASEIEKEFAKDNLTKALKIITGSNLSWEEAENLCTVQEELMIMESKIEVSPKK